MNRTGIQNYLSNVFVPIYTYDSVAKTFTPKLELSNVDTYSGNSVSVFTAAVGDAANNVYVGSNAGNPFNIIKSVSNVTAIGFAAGNNISNVNKSVYVGFYAGAGAAIAGDVIAIGANTSGNGFENIFMGTSNGTVGSSNILIGHYISPGIVSNQIRIGNRSRIPIAADMSTNWVGLGGMLPRDPDVNIRLDVSGSACFSRQVGISRLPEKTLDVNGDFRVNNGQGVLTFTKDEDTNRTFFKADDLVGYMTFTNDSTSNTTLTVASSNANTIAIVDVSGAVKASSGFASLRGSNTIPDTQEVAIAPLKLGIMMISAIRPEALGLIHASRIVLVTDITTPTVSTFSSNTGGFGLDITFTPSNVNISNGTGVSDITVDWNVTYFPTTGFL